MTIAVISARSRMRRLAAVKTVSVAAGEALALAALLVERLDDLHRAEHFAGDRADVGDAVLALGRYGADLAPEDDDRDDDERNAEQHHPGELGREEEQDDDAGDRHDDVAQRDRHGGADDLFDDRRVDGQPAGDLGRAVFLEVTGREAEQIAVHREADVGDDALAEPGDEVEARRGGDRHDHHQDEEVLEPRRDVAAAPEAAVDDQLEGIRHARGRRRCDEQGATQRRRAARDSGGHAPTPSPGWKETWSWREVWGSGRVSIAALRSSVPQLPQLPHCDIASQHLLAGGPFAPHNRI